MTHAILPNHCRKKLEALGLPFAGNFARALVALIAAERSVSIMLLK